MPDEVDRTAPRQYDPLVGRSASASRRLRPTSTIRGALAAGFAVVFGLWGLSGYELIRSLRGVETQVAAAHQSFARSEQTLSVVRGNVLLVSIYLRDALIDAGPMARDYDRREIRRLRVEIEERLPAYLLEVRLPIEQQHWALLQSSLERFWASLEFVFSPGLPSNTAQAASMLRRDVVPARNNVLSVADNLTELQRLAQSRHEVDVALLYQAVRTRFLTIVSSAVVIGLLVASFAFRHVGGLEGEIHRQRLAEAQHRRDLERLSARLVDAQEQERRTLARELHDEVGQALTAIKMEVGVALRSVDTDTRTRASLEEARAIAETTLQSVRDLSQLLHPSMLDDFGLPETLAAYLRSFSKRAGIRAQLAHPGLDARLPTDVEVCVYRIVQEALTNVARHSGALACSVNVTQRNGMLSVVIDDCGRGLGSEADRTPDVRRGLGLIGMRERAQALAGSFAIENRAEGGTRVTVTLPIPVDVAAAARRMVS